MLIDILEVVSFCFFKFAILSTNHRMITNLELKSLGRAYSHRGRMMVRSRRQEYTVASKLERVKFLERKSIKPFGDNTDRGGIGGDFWGKDSIERRFSEKISSSEISSSVSTDDVTKRLIFVVR